MLRVLMTMAIGAILAGQARAETLMVCAEGGADYVTIEEAIAASSDGDVVELCDGFYEAGLIQVLGKAITVRSAAGDASAVVLTARLYFEGTETIGSRLENLTFRGHGGAWGPVGFINATPIVVGCVFEGNSATYFGGACLISCGRGLVTPPARFVSCVFRGNATQSGGAIWVGGADIEFENCLFAGNRARREDGGAIAFYGEGHVLSFLRCTVAGNDGPSGGAIFASGAELTANQSILWGNSETNGPGLRLLWNTVADFRCSILDAERVAVLGGSVLNTTDVMPLDPEFCDPERSYRSPTIEGDYTLTSSSPAAAADCGFMGVEPVGCEPVSIEPWTWSRTKASYR